MKNRLLRSLIVIASLAIFICVTINAAAQTSPNTLDSYYRLRVSYTTTSDSSTLEVYDPSILAARIVSIQGSPDVNLNGINSIHIGQSYYDALLGKAVGADVDFIATSDIVNNPPEFVVRSGSLHGSSISIYNVSGGQTQFLQRIVSSGGQTFFTLDVSNLKQTPPLHAPSPQIDFGRKALAFYYPWYTMSSWSSSLLKDRPATLYSSDDPNAIATQIDQAKSAGIDGFISSWWGPGSPEDANFQKLLAVAQTKNFPVTIHFETLIDNLHPRDANQIYDWLVYALQNYGNHPMMLKIGGKPVIFIYASNLVAETSWQSIFAKLRAQNLDAFFIGYGTDTSILADFNGLHEYGYIDSVWEDLLPGLGANVRYFYLLSTAGTPRKLWSPSVAPGFDETLLSGLGRSGRFFDRANGAFYENQFDVALKSSPDWLLITSWNEYYENTYIEPSVRYGDQYLKLTRDRVSQWKAANNNFVKFSSATYTVGEGDGDAIITVTRAGDLSYPATIDYATQDGTAKQTKDYTAAVGTLSFGVGEASKTFSVPITDNAYADGARTINLTLTNPNGALLSTPNAAVLTITDNDTTNGSANPIDDPNFFVRQQYRDFLGREPDAAGFQFWVGQITACGGNAACIDAKRANVSAAYFLSTEFQQTGYLFFLTYEAAFVAMPKYSDFVASTLKLGQGVVVGSNGWQQQLENNKQIFFDSFVNRPAFRLLYESMSNDQYVDALISNIGVGFSSSDRDALVNGLNNGTETRATVLRKITENQVFTQKEFNRAFVLMQYFGYLRRNPDDPPDGNLNGYNFWLNKLNYARGDYIGSQMVRSFIISDEYRKRFGSH